MADQCSILVWHLWIFSQILAQRNSIPLLYKFPEKDCDGPMCVTGRPGSSSRTVECQDWPTLGHVSTLVAKADRARSQKSSGKGLKERLWGPNRCLDYWLGLKRDYWVLNSDLWNQNFQGRGMRICTCNKYISFQLSLSQITTNITILKQYEFITLF